MNEDFQLTDFDRTEVIKLTNEKYDLLNNGYISFSGGRDSTILHYKIDEVFPNNRIPRVFIDTGIEYQYIRDFVLELAKNDDRFIILKPSQPIKQMLDKYGYPFKSKQHSHNYSIYCNNKEEIHKVMQMIKDNPKLKEDYNFIHNLPKGVKTIVKYLTGERERERCLLLSRFALKTYGINSRICVI